MTAVAANVLALVRVEVSRLSQIVNSNPAVQADLASWIDTVTTRVDAVEAVIAGQKVTRRPSWHSGDFLRRVRDDRVVDEHLAQTLLSPIRAVEHEIGRLLEAAPSPNAETARATAIAVGNLIAEFASVESALYAAFPQLEPQANAETEAQAKRDAEKVIARITTQRT
jgi:hypothetical protein